MKDAITLGPNYSEILESILGAPGFCKLRCPILTPIWHMGHKPSQGRLVLKDDGRAKLNGSMLRNHSGSQAFNLWL